MRPIIISYYLPPGAEVGGIRPDRMARSWAQQGIPVEVITPVRPDGEYSDVVGSGNLTIHGVQSIPNPRHWVREWKAAFAGAKTDPAAAEENWARSFAKRNQGSVSTIRRHVLSALWLPDDNQGFIIPAVRLALALIREGRGDVVYVTGPPFSVHVAGALVKRLAGLPLVVEYRDPWIEDRKTGATATAWALRCERGLQRWCLSAADLVVGVTSGIAETVRNRVNSPAPVLAVLNGLDRTQVRTDPVTATGPLRILHAGELYVGRDPEPFLRAIAQLRVPLDLTSSALEILFIGRGRWYRGRSVEALVRELGIADLVRFQDSVPFAACQQLTAEADILLLLAQDQPTQVPNKLYDYLAARRPILAYVDLGGESDRILSRLQGHGIVAGNDDPRAVSVVAEMLERGRVGRLDPNEPGLVEITWDEQVRPLTEAVAALSRRKNRTLVPVE